MTPTYILRSSLLPFLLLTASPSLACVNTTYSRAHEIQITSDLSQVLIGAFASHGDAFYEQELKRTETDLEQNPNNYETQIDQAVAHLKLSHWSQAEDLLLAINAQHPDRYKTHANLGVLYKKMAVAKENPDLFTKAAHHTRISLEIKPEGHLGLGDYYLKMLAYRAAGESTTDNFLGIPYAPGPAAVTASPLTNKEHLITLIKADRHYWQTYLVLGDVLFQEGDLQNAARAWVHAKILSADTPVENPAAITFLNKRLDKLSQIWRNKAATVRSHIADPHYEDQIESEINAATSWLESFHKTEAHLLKFEPTVDFKTVIAEMETWDTPRPVQIEVGYYEGTVSDNNSLLSFAYAPLAIAGILILGLLP